MFYSSVCALGTLSGGLRWTPRMTIDKLSEDVLLEIFDAYRQLYESSPRYAKVWNGRDGWFKLTHVCRSWRRLVHLSPSRLHVHFLFMPRRSSRVTMLKNLPPFPILVDYYFAEWTERELNLALAAIRHRDRVRGISLRRRQYTDMTKILRALSRPFPELESLEIRSTYDQYFELTLPPTFLSGSASCLRRLTLHDVVPKSLSSPLSTATGLVELSLLLRVSYGALPETSFISNLQRMPCLRRLELRLKDSHHTIISDSPQPPTVSGDIVPLPNLIQFTFTGQQIYLEAFVAVLAAPSPQHLDTEVSGATDAFPIPHLCRFICDTDNQFILVRLDFYDYQLQFTAKMRSQSVHAQPFRIVIPEPVSLEEVGNRLSEPLATVEELVVGWYVNGERHVQWHKFFDHMQQVKLIQVPLQVAHGVAESLQVGQNPVMDALPALERVNVDMTQWHFSSHRANRNSQYHETIPDAFEPLIAAREKVGHPITLSFT